MVNVTAPGGIVQRLSCGGNVYRAGATFTMRSNVYHAGATFTMRGQRLPCGGNVYHGVEIYHIFANISWILAILGKFLSLLAKFRGHFISSLFQVGVDPQ